MSPMLAELARAYLATVLIFVWTWAWMRLLDDAEMPEQAAAYPDDDGWVRIYRLEEWQ